MGKYTNPIHVYNFGYFYMPSYHDGYEDQYDMDLDNGKLSVWEGDLETAYLDQVHHSPKWPII